MSLATIELVSTAPQTRSLTRKLMRVPEELRRGLRPALREAGATVLQDATRRSMWSSRIPNSLRMRVSFSQRKPGVFITADAGTAPHARPFEGITGRGSFRHPTFDDDPWVEQATRPFLLPALEANEGQARDAIANVIDQTLARVGL